MYLYGMLGTTLLFLGLVKGDPERAAREAEADGYTKCFARHIAHRYAKMRPFRG